MLSLHRTDPISANCEFEKEYFSVMAFIMIQCEKLFYSNRMINSVSCGVVWIPVVQKNILPSEMFLVVEMDENMMYMYILCAICILAGNAFFLSSFIFESEYILGDFMYISMVEA